jgi:hypothetical protein
MVSLVRKVVLSIITALMDQIKLRKMQNVKMITRVVMIHPAPLVQAHQVTLAATGAQVLKTVVDPLQL